MLKPCSPEIELRNSDGTLVKLDEKRDLGEGYFSICDLGGSSGSFEILSIKKGAIIRNQLTLNKDCVNNGYFVSRPGTYTATAIWHAHSEDPKIKVDVRSKPVTFRITGE